MKIINIVLWWFLLVVCCTACSEDKGNYDYQDLISLKLDTAGKNLSSGVTAYQFENYTLDPGIQYGGDVANLEYVWKLYLQKPIKPQDQAKFDSAKVLSKDAVFNQIIYDLPGEYYLNLEVTDKVSDTKTYLRFKFKIESTLSRGLCVLDEKNGEYDLNMIKSSKLLPDLPADKEGVIYNVFSNVNNVKAVDGKFLGQAFPRGKTGDFYFFTTDGGYKLDQSTFRIKTSDYKALFAFSAGMTFAPQVYVSVPTGSSAEFLINNGKLHMMKHMYSETVFGDRLNGDFVMEPFMAEITNSDSPILVFDKTNKKFVPIEKFGGLNAYESTPSAAFDVNHVDKKMVFMGQGYNSYTYAVFNDPGTSNYYLYEGDFSAKVAVPKAVYNMNVCTGLDENSLYAIGSRGAYCFYSAGSDLYLYTYTSNSSAPAVPTFSGETITSMKIFKKTGHPLDGRLLIVATYTGTEGKIYLLDFNEINGTVNPEGLSKPISKFGRIKDFLNKE